MNRSTPSSAVPRAGYHHGNLREALLEAGLVHLEASGGEDLSLREMARQAGVAPNAVYRHFSSKEALLVALAAEGFRRLRAAQQAAMRGTDVAVDAMTRSGRAYIDFARAHPALFRLMFGRFTSDRRDPELSEAMRATFEQLRTAVAAAAKDQLNEQKLSVRTIHALALVHGLSQLSIDGQIADWAGDPAAAIAGVMEYAAQLRIPRRAG